MNKRDVTTLYRAAEIVSGMNVMGSKWLTDLTIDLRRVAEAADVIDQLMAKPKETGHDG